MFLSALTFAAALQAAPVAGQKGYLLQRKPFETSQRVDQPRLPFPKRPPLTREELERLRAAGLKEKPVQMPKLAKVRRVTVPACARPPLEYAAKREPAAPHRLDDLPPAHGERAVLRKVDGCPVATPIALRDEGQ